MTHLQALKRLRDLLNQLARPVVDDPEEVLNELGADAGVYVAALDFALQEIGD